MRAVNGDEMTVAQMVFAMVDAMGQKSVALLAGARAALLAGLMENE